MADQKTKIKLSELEAYAKERGGDAYVRDGALGHQYIEILVPGGTELLDIEPDTPPPSTPPPPPAPNGKDK